MSIKLSKKSVLGDYDIILEAGKNMFFDHVILGNYHRHYQLPKHKVRYISWHGFYEIIDEKNVLAPVVRVKDILDKTHETRHYGIIDLDEPYAFPVCSLYVPNLLNTEILGKTKRNKKTHYIDVYSEEDHKDIRIDLFVLPSGLSLNTIKNSPIKLMYHFPDLEIFNKPENGYNVLLDSEVKYFVESEGPVVFYRIVKDINNLDFTASKTKIFNDVSQNYTLIINDPNDVYNKLSDFIIIEYDEGFKIPTTLRTLHVKSLRKD